LSIIEGSLSIGTEDHFYTINEGEGNCSLISLAGLDGLTSVGNTLTITSNESLEEISALNNLNALNGELIISHNNVLQNLNGLDNIDKLRLRLRISGNDSLKDISALSNIDSLLIEGLYIYDNKSLSTCNTESVCAYLANAAGHIDIHQNAPGCNNPGEVANQCGFEMPCYTGTLYFTSQADIDAFKDLYADCPELTGEVIISGNDISDLHGLDEIHSIQGNLIIKENEILTDLEGLENLSSIESGYDWRDGNVKIEKNDALASLSGLNNLVSIDGELLIGHPEDELSGNASLFNLSGLDNLASVGGILLHYNDLLSDVTGMDNLDTIKGLISIKANPSLLTLEGFPGDVYYTTSSRFWPGISIIDNDALVDLSGLEFIDTILCRLEICENDALTSLQGLDNLRAIEEYGFNASMIIINNSALVNLSGLENLRSVGYAQGYDNWDRIEIRENNALESLKGIENIEAASIHDIYIRNNPNLSDCAVKSICDYLSFQNAYQYTWWWDGPDIDSNMVGCNSIEEVLEVCMFGVSDNISQQSYFIYPNPFTTSITISYTLDSPENIRFTVYNVQSQIVYTIEEWRERGEQHLQWNADGLPAGLYYFRIQTGEKVGGGKMVKME
jgi:hypothetical protein